MDINTYEYLHSKFDKKKNTTLAIEKKNKVTLLRLYINIGIFSAISFTILKIIDYHFYELTTQQFDIIFVSLYLASSALYLYNMHLKLNSILKEFTSYINKNCNIRINSYDDLHAYNFLYSLLKLNKDPIDDADFNDLLAVAQYSTDYHFSSIPMRQGNVIICTGIMSLSISLCTLALERNQYITEEKILNILSIIFFIVLLIYISNKIFDNASTKYRKNLKLKLILQKSKIANKDLQVKFNDNYIYELEQLNKAYKNYMSTDYYTKKSL